MRLKKQVSIATIIGCNIKYFRQKKRLRVADLAQELNVTVQTWYKWEGGKAIPEDLHQIAIAKALRVNLDEIRNGIGGPIQTTPARMTGIDPTTKRLFSTLTEAHTAFSLLGEDVVAGKLDVDVVQFAVEEALKIVWQVRDKPSSADKRQNKHADKNDTGTAQ